MTKFVKGLTFVKLYTWRGVPEVKPSIHNFFVKFVRALSEIFFAATLINSSRL
jgi:hypothetical protein